VKQALTATAVLIALTGAASAPRADTPPPPAPAAPSCADKPCHGTLVRVAHPHPPAREDCASCHAPTGAAHPDSARAGFKLVAEGGELCAPCHEAFPGRESVHPPVAGGECLSCHDPHGSAQQRLLKQPLNALCFQCHEAGDFKVHAVVGVTLGSGHPLGGAPDPARKGETLSCVSCHDPHASDTPRLWRFGATTTFDLCGNCHRK
jgi:predicted CXXCH cytochrome family protein